MIKEAINEFVIPNNYTDISVCIYMNGFLRFCNEDYVLKVDSLIRKKAEYLNLENKYKRKLLRNFYSCCYSIKINKDRKVSLNFGIKDYEKKIIVFKSDYFDIIPKSNYLNYIENNCNKKVKSKIFF